MITLTPLPPVSELQALWTSLAAQSPHSFFLSWQWIGTWLHCLGSSARPGLATVKLDAEPVAMAIVCKDTIWRRGVLPVKTWALNATGREKFDCVTIEYNGLLTVSHKTHEAWTQLLDYFCEFNQEWDEIELKGIDPALTKDWSDRGFAVRHMRLDKSRYVDLAGVRESPDCSCVGRLAPRVRTRIRHTASSLNSRYGNLRIRVAESKSEALEVFATLKHFHNRRWAKHKSGGSFSKPFFEYFHRELIVRHFDDAVIQMATILAGEVILGVFYNFTYQGRVYFYQSGINYDVTERHESPGLLFHSMLIDFNASNGFLTYDMLAGDCQYKRALTQRSNEMWWGALQAPRLRLRAERALTIRYRTLRKTLRS